MPSFVEINCFQFGHDEITQFHMEQVSILRYLNSEDNLGFHLGATR